MANAVEMNKNLTEILILKQAWDGSISISVWWSLSLNGEHTAPAEVTEWLGFDKLDECFNILNDEILSTVTDVEEEEIGDNECYISNEKLR